MNILFIDPPYQRFMGYYRFYYPLGLASMSAVLSREKHSVFVHDADHTPDGKALSFSAVAEKYDDYKRAVEDDGHAVWNEIANHVTRIGPRIVGISMLSVKQESASKIARLCKQLDKEILVVVGADHPTVVPETVLRDPNIDVAVRGEGEMTMVELAAALDSSARLDCLERIHGISYRVGSKVKHNPPRQLILDLDSLPSPALDTLLQRASYRPEDFGAIMASRGCPYGCTFCGVQSIWTRQVRYRSPANVFAEVQRLWTTCGTTYFSFRDPCFTLSRSRVLEFCRLLREACLAIEWECLTRADLLDEDLLRNMRSAGCVTIRLGIESGDPRVLQSMHKQVDLDAVREAASLLRQNGFYWTTYLLFGTPSETVESIRRTLDFIREIDPPFITLARYAPIPGTVMFKELERAGRVSPVNEWSREMNQQFSSNYVFAMSPEVFEGQMREVASVVEAHNASRRAKLGRWDRRLEAQEAAAEDREALPNSHPDVPIPRPSTN